MAEPLTPKKQGRKIRKTPSKFMRTSGATPRTPASVEGKRQTSDLTGTPTTPGTATGERLDGLEPSPPKFQAPVVTLPNGQTLQLLVVDMSNQALTTIPDNLWENNMIGVLDLSANNISQVPASIVQLPYLHELHINNTSIRCRGPQDNEGLSRNLAKLSYLHTLSIQCCNLVHVPPIIWELRNLTELYLNRNRIYTLPAEIGKLKKLKKLNLQLTGLTTLPPEIAYCQELEELVLLGNALNSLPETVSELTKLRTLSISYRVFTAANVDAYMENLISKQQILSEHISPVVFHLQSLREMDLSFTKINTFPSHNLQSLTSLDLSNNFIRIFPESVTKLHRLRELNVTNNELSALPDTLAELGSHLRRLRIASNRFQQIPTSVWQLINLREFDCSKNQISEVPDEITHLAKLRLLNLSYNNLKFLPTCISDLAHLETLDVRKNHISEVPNTIHKMDSLNLMHTFDGLKRTGFWLLGNAELAVPPPIVWMGDDMGLLCDSVRRLAVQDLAADRRLNTTRLIFLGDSDAVKTDMVKQLLGINYLDRGSRICGMHRWSSSNGVPFIVYNLHTEFEAANHLMPLFLIESSVVVLLFNFNELDSTEPTAPSCLERWLNAISVCAPGAVVKLVGITRSKGDDEDQDNKTTRSIIPGPLCNQRTKIEFMKYNKRISSALTRFQLEINDAPLAKSRLPALRRIFQLTLDRLNMLSELNSRETLLRTCCEVTLLDNWSNADRWEELEWQVELLATNTMLTPHVQYLTPKTWHDFGKRLLQKRNPLIDWQEAVQEASVSGVDPGKDQEDALRFLEASGIISRYLPGRWIAVRPQQLMSALEPIVGDEPVVEKLVLKHRARFPDEKLQQATTALRDKGSLCEALLKTAIFFPTASHATSMKQTEKLLEEFGLAYVRNDTEFQGKVYQQSWFTTSIIQMIRPVDCYDDDEANDASLWPEAYEGGDSVQTIEFWPVIGCQPEMCRLFTLFQVRLHQAAWFYLEPRPGQSVVAEIRRTPDSEFTRAYVVAKLLKDHSSPKKSCYVTVTARGSDELYVSWALDVVADIVTEFYQILPGVLLSGTNCHI